MRSLVKGVAASTLLLSAPAFAIPVTWTDWTAANATSAVGTMGGINVLVTAAEGSVLETSRTQTACGTNWWTQPDASDLAYTGGTVSNAPTPCEQVALNQAGTYNVTFSGAVSGLYIALLSVGQPGLQVVYDFNRPFTVDSEGAGFWGNGSYSTGAGDQLLANEFHGVLLFSGSISSLSFSAAPNEFWHSFTFGRAEPVAVPVAGTLPLLAIGLAVLRLSRRRRLG